MASPSPPLCPLSTICQTDPSRCQSRPSTSEEASLAIVQVVALLVCVLAPVIDREGSFLGTPNLLSVGGYVPLFVMFYAFTLIYWGLLIRHHARPSVLWTHGRLQHNLVHLRQLRFPRIRLHVLYALGSRWDRTQSCASSVVKCRHSLSSPRDKRRKQRAPGGRSWSSSLLRSFNHHFK